MLFLAFFENSDSLSEPVRIVLIILAVGGLLIVPLMILAQAARALENAARPRRGKTETVKKLPQQVRPLFYNADGTPIESLKK